MLATSSRVMVQQEEARAELARRELARRHLVDFSCYVAPYYRPARHHRLVGEHLEQVETYVRSRGATGIGRLLILEPPRYGKSEQMSRHFPPWVLGRLPDTHIILTSYIYDLAAKFSRAARDVVLSTPFRAVFGELASIESPVEMSEDSRSVKAWELAAPHRGGMIATGVGGGITGSGANLFLVDDPFKNREEAESESHRESVWEWWTSTAYTRLEDGAAVVASLTRWHADDWAGRLLKAMAMDPKADRWVVLCLPAIAEGKEKINTNITNEANYTNAFVIDMGNGFGKVVGNVQDDFEKYQREKMLEGIWVDREDALERKPGEALWPEKYSEEDLERIRINIGEYDFEALYQQRPYSRTGNYFQKPWFAIEEAPPKMEEMITRMWFWDTAGSKTGEGDYACGVVMSLSKDRLVHVENVARKQGTPGDCRKLMKDSLLADKATGRPIKCIWHQQGGADSGLDSAQSINRMLAELGFTARFQTVRGNKEERAGNWSTALQGGQVRLVRGGWNQIFIDEHIGFPRIGHDDQVDAASWGYNKLVGRMIKEARSYQG